MLSDSADIQRLSLAQALASHVSRGCLLPPASVSTLPLLLRVHLQARGGQGRGGQVAELLHVSDGFYRTEVDRCTSPSPSQPSAGHPSPCVLTVTAILVTHTHPDRSHPVSLRTSEQEAALKRAPP